jgi:hypothetical protein
MRSTAVLREVSGEIPLDLVATRRVCGVVVRLCVVVVARRPPVDSLELNPLLAVCRDMEDGSQTVAGDVYSISHLYTIYITHF